MKKRRRRPPRPAGTWPHSKKYTRELAQMAATPNLPTKEVHELYIELGFRERKAARQLREQLAAQLKQREYFTWPSTEAPQGGGDMDTAHFQHEQGPLGFMGYRVGKNGLAADKRRDLLSGAYAGQLPPINSPEYMAKWDAPGTGERLKKIADSIAARARDATRNDAARYRQAIQDWKSDLKYLKEAFYDGRYDHDFVWPEA